MNIYLKTFLVMTYIWPCDGKQYDMIPPKTLIFLLIWIQMSLWFQMLKSENDEELTFGINYICTSITNCRMYGKLKNKTNLKHFYWL